MDGDLQCPQCGHDLSVWQPPETSRGELLAMRIADVVASWWFPATVLGLVAAWVVWNVAAEPFSPYPVIIFAVLSAALATLAAMQGPLILLAQRRGAERDRLRDEEALRVAISAEADLHRLEEKIDAIGAALIATPGGTPAS